MASFVEKVKYLLIFILMNRKFKLMPFLFTNEHKNINNINTNQY